MDQEEQADINNENAVPIDLKSEQVAYH